MEVILAEHLGFCYGVKRAIEIARENASPDGTSSTLGPIIHNPQMVERLKEEGVGTVSTLDEMQDGTTVIIRSHGVGPSVYAQAEQRGLNLVDATCPHVKKAQLSAKQLSEEGYTVVIIGEKNHPEVKSIFEWTAQRAHIIAAMDLAEHVDAMIVVGGKNSANTMRLAQLCSEKCRTYHIETADELQSDWLNHINKIGITAGASTPDWIIKEVFKQCQSRA